MTAANPMPKVMNGEQQELVATRMDELLDRAQQCLETAVEAERTLSAALDTLRAASDHIDRCNRRHKPNERVQLYRRDEPAANSDDEQDALVLDHIAACHADIVHDLDEARNAIARRQELWLGLNDQYRRDRRILTLRKRARSAATPVEPSTNGNVASEPIVKRYRTNLGVHEEHNGTNASAARESSPPRSASVRTSIGAAQFAYASDDSTMLSSPEQLSRENAAAESKARAEFESVLDRADRTVRAAQMRRRLYD